MKNYPKKFSLKGLAKSFKNAFRGFSVLLKNEYNLYIQIGFAVAAVFAGFIFKISANRFLRNMVRAIVGTLLDVGIGRINLADLQIILESRNRSKAGTSVPANGLALVSVDYPVGYLSNEL